MEPISQFDELYVISDVHMGGVKSQGDEEEVNRQIFNQGPRLAAWIRSLSKHRDQRKIGLVINGDMVDFLAEPGASYFDPQGAVRKLVRIAGDASFRDVWQALRDFVNCPQRQLIWTLGNHELELALPWVREALLQRLSGGGEEARGRIVLQFDGSGYLCQVGSAKVYCVHGNDVDTWNLVPYDRLRRIGCELWRGRPVEPWIPNAGTQLVIDVMNAIKTEHPFVDLLKPEVEAVVPIVYALDPSQADKLDEVAAVAARLTWDKVKRSLNLLSAEGEESPTGAGLAPARGEMLGGVLQHAQARQEAADPGQEEAETLLRNAHWAHQIQRRRGAAVPSPSDVPDAFLRSRLASWCIAAYRWFVGKPPEEILRAALEGLKKDRSFDLKHADAMYERMEELVGPEIDFVITGHTHLERALQRKRGGGYYYNTGTWVRLIRLTDDVLGSAENFARVYAALSGKEIKTLDDFQPPLVMQRPAVVSIVAANGAVRGALNRVGGRDQRPILQAVENSVFTR